MATLSHEGRIDIEVVEAEISRLSSAWGVTRSQTGDSILIEVLGEARASELDRFDAPQLAEVIRVCRNSASASAAGRELFAVSRLGKTSSNDADRLKKYLARFGLRFDDVANQA
jgi:transcriptional regulatory protein RtcR